MGKGARVEIIMGGALVIVGEVRYSRRGGEAVYAGILIQQVVHPRRLTDEHINDDVLSCYLVGKGLTVPEVIGLKEHLILCEACQIRLAEANAILHPIRKRKSWAHLGYPWLCIGLLTTARKSPHDPTSNILSNR